MILHPEAMMKPDELVARLESSYGVELPARLRSFLLEREHRAAGKLLHLERGYLRGWFEPDFYDADLADLAALGEKHWIDDLEDVEWAADYGDLVPLATIADAFADPGAERFEPAKAFLVVQVTDAECPVYVWEYDGWRVYPLAASLDDFLAGRAWTGKQPLAHERLGSSYTAFRWLAARPAAGRTKQSGWPP
jgi:hypothetical protein